MEVDNLLLYKNDDLLLRRFSSILKDKRVDDLISKTRDVEEYLKVLHLRYESLRLPPKSDHLRWWEYSQKGNKEILSEIKTHLEEMGTHLGEMKMILEEK